MLAIAATQAPKYEMRFHELLEARQWRNYRGEQRQCSIGNLVAHPALDQPKSATVIFGTVDTGRQRVWAGYFVRVEMDGRTWLGEDAHSLRRALRGLENSLNADGYSLLVIGLDADWRESGLSANTGWGFCSDVEGAIHMLVPKSSVEIG